jgi:hypothetical protein
MIRKLTSISALGLDLASVNQAPQDAMSLCCFRGLTPLMKTYLGPYVVVALLTVFPVCKGASAAEDAQGSDAASANSVSQEALNAASELIRQTGLQIRAQI